MRGLKQFAVNLTVIGTFLDILLLIWRNERLMDRWTGIDVVEEPKLLKYQRNRAPLEVPFANLS